MKRIDNLILKELDGDLSVSEAVELERVSLTDPDVRRGREAWRRATAALREMGPEAPVFAVDAMAARVSEAVRRGERPSGWFRYLAGWLDTGFVMRRTWAMSASAVVALAGIVLWPSMPASELARSAVEARPALPPPAPVEVRVAFPSPDEHDEAPVSIRF